MKPIFPYFENHVEYDPSMERMTDIHLYTGSFCNRTCDFCIVYGEPKGWYQPIDIDHLELAFRLLAPDGNVKFYGGEPTLDHENILYAIRECRRLGFRGWFTLFTNGIQAGRVIELLESDDRVEAVLNYSILHGEGAEPIPEPALEKLKKYAEGHPNRIYCSHQDLVPIGRGFDRRKPARGDFEGGCARCRPVVTTRGCLHACPFAVEFESPHYDLGDISTPEATAQANYRKFLRWVDDVLEPAAGEKGLHPCQVCHKHRGELPTYREWQGGV